MSAPVASPSIVYLNGRYVPRAEAMLPIDERGFFFGDGVYEVTRVIDGKLIFPELHNARLQRGLDALKLQPAQTIPELDAIARALIEKNGMTTGEGTVYLQITRGVAPRLHQFPPKGTPCTVFLATASFDVAAIKQKREKGVAVITVPDTRWARCDLKTVNLLPNVLAKQQAFEADAFEAMFVKDGTLMEGSLSSAFFVKDDVLRTHPATNAILPGITRAVLLECAKECGIPVEETAVKQAEIPQLSECFMAGTTADVMPVVSIDGVPVGNGAPGPVAARLYAALAARLYGGKVAKAAA